MHLLSVFSLRNRALIALVAVVVAVFGSITLTSLKQELIPPVSFPQLVVVTNYPGATPDVVNQDVSTPIETAIQSVAGLQSTTATSQTNLSSVSASFNYGTDLVTAQQKVEQAINRIKSTLPTGVDPRVVTGSLDDLPVIRVAVTSDLAPKDLSTQLAGAPVTAIQALAGVRAATLLGTVGQRVTITPNKAAMLAHGLTNQSIRDALRANGSLIPDGSITENGQTLTVQAGTRITSTAQIGALPLTGMKPVPGSPVITIADVATIALVDNPITSISRVNGQPALTIAVTKTPDGNTVEVSKLVRGILPGLEKSLGNNTRFTVVFDQAPYIQQSIDSLATEGMLGLFFAVIVILIFLLSVRSTLVTAISIPLSVLITFIGMQAANYSLNIITLGALTIAIGRVVDDSIVVIENIKRHLSLGEAKLAAITTAVREVATAVTASTLTTVAVFLPLALVGDITGELFRPFALTVTIALAASLFVALTIVPVLAYWFLRPATGRRHAGLPINPHGVAPAVAGDELEHPTRMQRFYLPVIHWTLKRPLATIIAALLILGGTVALVPSMKTNFLGDSGQNTVTIQQTLPAGTSLAAQDAAARKVEAVLGKVTGVKTVQLSIGSSTTSLRSAFLGGGGITFSLTTDPNADQVALQRKLRDSVAGLTGVGDVAVQAASSGFSSSDIAVNITANKQADLQTAADRVLAAVQRLGVIAHASSNLSAVQPYLAIVVDRDKAAAVGLTEVAVGAIVADSMLPASVGSVVIDNTTLSIYITDPNAPTTLQQLQDFVIPTPRGPVPLASLAAVSQANGPSSITTVKGFRSATITATPNSNDVGTASAAVQKAVDGVALPAGATATLGGVTSQQATSFSQLGLALLVAILIVYVVMVATFKSLRQPLLLMVSVPFAATGAILLQVASGVPLGVASLIGVLMLVGIVVTNAIVLVDLINQYRARGMKVGEAIVHGASRRLRPILMTAFATIFALLPMAIGLTGHGGFISQPLAIVVIGGLVSSTLLTLVVLPVLYYLVEGARERRVDRVAAVPAGEAVPAE